jgi:lipoate-protein ligase B
MVSLRDISAPPVEVADPPRPARPRADPRAPLLLGDGGLLTVEWLGRVPYRPTWDLQNDLAERRRRREIGDRLLLLEHEPVYTLGRGGDAEHLLATAERLAEIGAELVRIDRGGDITFHGPGQLVAYPIIPLNQYGLNLHSYMRLLEQAIIDTLAPFGIAAVRDPSPCSATGVWVRTGGQEGAAARADETAGATSCAVQDSLHTSDYAKICALGIKVRRWVTFHGIALNVTTDLAFFQLINPCGLSRPVTSMQRILDDRTPSMQAVKDRFSHAMNTLLQRTPAVAVR